MSSADDIWSIDRLADWLALIEQKAALLRGAERSTPDVQRHAQRCLELIPRVRAQSSRATRDPRETGHAMLAAVELADAFNAMATTAAFESPLQSAERSRSGGVKSATRLHSPTATAKRAEKVAEKWRRIGVTATRLKRGGHSRVAILEALTREFRVKRSTLEKKLKSGVHLPRSR